MNRNLLWISLALALASQTTSAATLTVTTADNYLPDGTTVAPGSLMAALQSAGPGDTIAFNISGAGPHVIVTPLGGYPLITADNLTIDGYTQPGSAPNTNPILGGNNARIRIVLDSTGADTAPNPANPELPLGRSTRLDFPTYEGNTGYGTSENAILGVFQADNVTARGLSFIGRHTPGTDADPSIYAVALVRQATNARVQGCWFGLAPGGTAQADLKPLSSAVAAFRWRIGGDVYSEGLVFGTDGDGVQDRAEFNVALGCRIALALELPQARVSGNYFNVFPDGVTFPDLDAIYQQLVDVGYDGPTVENIENGRVTDDTVIGTNGDGVSDADERNIFAHANYDQDIEFYSSALRAVIAGNYFGVGVDGKSTAPPLTNFVPILMELPGTGSVRIGSNGDGVSDDLEGNVIFQVPGPQFCGAGANVPIVCRGNRTVNNAFAALPFAEGENGRNYAGYYAPYLADSSQGAVPVLLNLTNGVLAGVIPAPNAATYPNVIIDLYTLDAPGLVSRTYWPRPQVHPATLLTTFQDNGPADLDPAPNAFSIDVSSFGLAPGAYVAVAVSYSMDPGAFNAERAVTSPMSNPVAAQPTLLMDLMPDLLQVQLSWLAPDKVFVAQANETLDPLNWLEPFLLLQTYSNGRNILTIPYDPVVPAVFYRLTNTP